MLFPSFTRTRQRLGAVLFSLLLITTARAATDEIVYFHTDANGSPTAAFNEAGAVCWTESYSPYGEKLVNDDNAPAWAGCGLIDTTDVAYTGHVQDASGLVYAQQRYYDPVIGRFMSTDPVMPNASDPRHFGRYHYGANNPYRYTDPTGESFAVPLAEVGAVAGAPLGPVGSFAGAVIGGGIGYYATEAIAESILDAVGLNPKEDTIEALKETPVTRIGDAFPDRDLPRNTDGTPAPETDVPHTQLGTKKSRKGGRYPQAREFGADGKPVRDIDVTDHGRPDEHDDPHQHDYEPNETGGTDSRGDSKALENP